MTTPELPSYEQWIDYVFKHAYPDFNGLYADEEGDGEAELRLHAIDIPLWREPKTLYIYMARLFLEPQDFWTRFDRESIDNAVSHVFSCSSEYWKHLICNEISDAKLSKLIASTKHLYKNIFDKLACNNGKQPDLQFTHDRLDRTIFMLWDLSGVEVHLWQDEPMPKSAEQSLQVLQSVLLECRTYTCRESALHGLGHMPEQYLPQARLIIDIFLDLNPTLPHELRDYARQCKTGMV